MTCRAAESQGREHHPVWEPEMLPVRDGGAYRKDEADGEEVQIHGPGICPRLWRQRRRLGRIFRRIVGQTMEIPSRKPPPAGPADGPRRGVGAPRAVIGDL